MGHTPGPWKSFRFFVAAEGSLRRIAECQSKSPGDPNYNDQTAIDEDCANARLIAASPELLEACRYCLDMLSQEAGGETVADRIGLIGGYRAVALLRAAIARAEGQPLGQGGQS